MTRRTRALVIGAAVVAVHVVLVERLFRRDLGDPAPPRIEVAFVRLMAPATPPPPPPAAIAPAEAADPVQAPPARPAARRRPESAPVRARAPAPLATAPTPAAAPPAPPAPPAPSAPAVSEPTQRLAELASVPSAALAMSATEPPFDWPPSTRLTYALQGHYRGPVDGSAQVEWLRDGDHYQVHLDVVVGLSFAPLLTRRMSSDGNVGFDGLVPRRYDEVTAMAFRDERRATIRFDAQRIALAGGREAPRPAGVQDAVSQFIQFAWRFGVDPSLLQRGRALSVPLALPRNVQTWTYEVGDEETLSTRFGPVQAVRLQPLRQPRAGGDLVAEAWYAPSLRYLPVRILIRQDEETFIDLMLDRLPQTE